MLERCKTALKLKVEISKISKNWWWQFLGLLLPPTCQFIKDIPSSKLLLDVEYRTWANCATNTLEHIDFRRSNISMSETDTCNQQIRKRRADCRAVNPGVRLGGLKCHIKFTLTAEKIYLYWKVWQTLITPQVTLLLYSETECWYLYWWILIFIFEGKLWKLETRRFVNIIFSK